jgi:hypothetical protein
LLSFIFVGWELCGTEFSKVSNYVSMNMLTTVFTFDTCQKYELTDAYTGYVYHEGEPSAQPGNGVLTVLLQDDTTLGTAQ